MTKIRVTTKEDAEYGYTGTVLTHLRPRRYMTGYSFNQLMDYIREELKCNDINPEEVICIEIFNKEEHWTDYIEKEEE